VRLTSIMLTGALAAMAAPAPATAQALTQRNMSLEIARALADRAGDMVLLMRGNMANPHNAELARRKAYTARTYGVSTMEFRNRTNGTDLEGQRELVDIIHLGGGLPVAIGMERIGGLGLSGAPTQEADDKCATQALKSAAAMLK